MATAKRVPAAKRAPAKKAARAATTGSVSGIKHEHLLPTAGRLRTPTTYEANTVFVGMSFRGEGSEDAFAAIRSTCRSLKLVAKRVDELTSSGFIILEIIDLIERAEFVVMDLTHERPNVYYELGYAHGVGNSPQNILLVARTGTELHFDIAAMRIQYYKSASELEQLVKVKLGAMLKNARA